MSEEALIGKPDLGIGSWPARRARHIPDKVAWTCNGVDTTYASVDRRVDSVAAALHAKGIRPGDRVAYLGANHPALLEVLFAAARVGAVTVLINPRLVEGEVRYILDDCGARVLVRGDGVGDDFGIFAEGGLPELQTFVVREGDGGAVPAGAEDYASLLDPATPPVPIGGRLEDPCLIMYTSGTTGRPKGAVLTHANILFNDLNTLIEYDLRPDEVCVASAPLSHIAMLNGLVLPVFLKGGRVIIEQGFRPKEMLEIIERERVSSIFAVPAMMDAMMREQTFGGTDLSALRTAIVGGAPVPMRTLHGWAARGVEIQQGYGLTETSPGISKLSALDAERKAGSAGKAQFFVDVRVVTADGDDVQRPGTGEILTRGPHVFAGYWRREQDTREAFTADGWFRTGDIAHIDEEGYLSLRARLKDMYVSGGENVYPAEVENALLDIDGIIGAAVIGVPHERWGETGKAFVVPGPGRILDAAAILEALDGRLARFKLPGSIEIVESLPTTSTGKLQKHLLRSTATVL